MKINVLIIGLGNIGLKYDFHEKSRNIFKTHSKSLSYHKNFNLIGAVEKDIKLRIKFQNKYKLPTYYNLSNALMKTAPEMIVVSIPTNLHFSFFKKILKYKSLKYVLFEKPLGKNIQECYKIIKLSEKNNIKLYVNYIRNYQNKITNFFSNKTIINTNKKNIITIYYTGTILNNCSHFLALIIKLYKFQNIKKVKLVRKFYNKPKEFNFVINNSLFIFKNKVSTDIRVNEIKISNLNYDIKFNSTNENILIYNNKTKKVSKINTGMKAYQLNVYKKIFIDINNNLIDKSSYLISYETHKLIKKINDLI